MKTTLAAADGRSVMLAGSCAGRRAAESHCRRMPPRRRQPLHRIAPSCRRSSKAIRAKYALKEKSFAAHDAETIVTQFYIADVISVGEGEGIFVGRDQIRPLYQQVVKDNKVSIDSVHTFVSGNAGWDWADFHVMPDKGEPFTFAILFLWTKVDGEWMCKGDFFVNGSLRSGKLTPPPSAPK